jgi:hypothetical protein
MFRVSAIATLTGFSAAAFGATESAGFIAALATSLNLSARAVTIASVADAASAGRRRALQTGGAAVAFSLSAPSYTAATGLVTGLVALLPSVFVVALQSNGLTACTGVSLSTPVLSVQTGDGQPPTVGAIAASPAGLVNPSTQLILSSAVISYAADSLRLQWSVVSAPAPLTLTADMAPASSVLGLPAGTLQPGGAYVFQLVAVDTNGQASATVSLTVMGVPVGGTLTVSPTNGTQLSTPFALSTAGWSDSNAAGAGLPLTYMFRYVMAGAAGELVVLSDYSAASNVSNVLLPAGLVQMQVLARNVLGGVAMVPAVANVSVAAQVFANATAQADFLTVLTEKAANLTGAASLALVTGAAAMLNDPSSPLNGDPVAAAQARASLLAAVAFAAANASTPVELQCVAVAVRLLVNNTAQVNAAGASAALGVLQFVAGANANGSGVRLTPEVGAAVTASLSSIVTAVLAPASGINNTLLLQVSNILDSLASSQLSDITTPGAPPVEVSSHAIQMRVSLDAVGASSRLFTQPLTAAGSASSFEPMPVGLFGNSTAAVRTQFVSLTFDPFEPGSSATATGVTRLAFSSMSGAEVAVSDLAAPVYFSLPRVPGLADGLKAQCQFWDKAALRYSTAGCVGQPALLPVGHNVSWVPDFAAHADGDMAAAWRISGPLIDGVNCSTAVLDCTQANNTQVVFPNPARPFDYPAVACNASISTAPMLVISGSRCPLIRKDNAYGCYYDNQKQAFLGAGCVAAAGPTQCACRHLTDFAGASKPSIPVCSLSDLTSFSFGDIVTKLKTLFEVVIILFGLMNGGALIGFALDARARARVVARFCQPQVGFRSPPGDPECWVWRFTLEPLMDDIDAPRGTAVALSAILGIPYVRLRAVLPDEMVESELCNAIGRREVFSVSGMMRSLTLQKKLTQHILISRHISGEDELAEVSRSFSSGAKMIATDEDDVTKPNKPDGPTMEEFVGTALVLAYLQASSLMPVVELARR